MSNPTPFITARRRVHRKRRDVPVGAANGLLIASVEVQAIANQLIVRFSGPIVWNGVEVPYEFVAFTEDGFMDPPANVLGAGADWMELEFNASVAPGAAWELNGPMLGISPEVSFPQAGVVV